MALKDEKTVNNEALAEETQKVINIYSKMQSVRCALLEMNLEKSGNNKFAGFKYFELGDFLPTITRLLNEHGLCSRMSFTNEEAKLTIINIDNPNELMEFTSPMSTAAVAKNGNEVQNLGAVQTYLRRYLYVAAFEIVENDGLDATAGNVETKGTSKTKANVNAKKIEKLIASKQVDADAVIQFAISTYNATAFNGLSDDQAKSLINMLEQYPDKNA